MYNKKTCIKYLVVIVFQSIFYLKMHQNDLKIQKKVEIKI